MTFIDMFKKVAVSDFAKNWKKIFENEVSY